MLLKQTHREILYINSICISKKGNCFTIYNQIHVLKINGSVYIGLVIKTRTVVFDFHKELTEIIKNNFL